MSYAAAADILRERFNAQAEILQPTLKRFVENRPPAPSFKAPYWTFEVHETDATVRLSDGFRRGGEVAVNCFVPANTGDKLLQELVRDAHAIFEQLRLKTSNSRIVKTRSGTPVPGASTPNHTQKRVLFDFHFDDLPVPA